MLTFIEAIARQEGFEVEDSRPARNNNPGDLNFEPWQGIFGARLETPLGKETARFACFPTPVQGWGAMRQLLNADYIGLTVRQALNKWAPPSDGNNVSEYEANVCEWTGMMPETVLTAENIG
jgi:hypothetical protein